MSVTVTIPMMMPSMVSAERSGLARSAERAIEIPSMVPGKYAWQAVGTVVSSECVRWSGIISSCSTRPSLIRMIRAGVAGNIFFVRNDDERVALFPQFAEQSHNVLAGFGIEITGGFVREI